MLKLNCFIYHIVIDTELLDIFDGVDEDQIKDAIEKDFELDKYYEKLLTEAIDEGQNPVTYLDHEKEIELN